METLSVAVLLLSFALVKGAVQLNTCHSSVCLSQTVQYQCTVSGESTLRWRVRNSTGNQIGTQTYAIGDELVTVTLATDFTTYLISNTDPLTSNMSFTAQSNLNNSVIQCEFIGGTPVSCTIIIEDPATIVPNNSMSFTANSFTSVTVSWSLPSVQQCLTNYQLVINNTNSNQQETINTTSTASTYTIINRTRGIEYCYTVSTVDTANRISNSSNSTCFTLDTPEQPDITNADYSNDTDSVIIEWMQPPVSSRPPVLAYVIIHNISTTDNITTTVLAPTTSTDITELVAGTRFIEVLASNTLGIGLPTQTVIVIPTSDIPTTSIISTTSVVSSSVSSTSEQDSSTIFTTISQTYRMTSIESTTVTPSSSGTPERQNNDLIFIIIGVVVGIIVIIIIVLLSIIICYIIYKKKQTKVNLDGYGGDDTDGPIALVNKKEPVPETGQPTYQDPSTIQRQEAPTGDLYAMPDKPNKSSRREAPSKPEAATYQDPSTIQRQEAPTGDLYALPAQKPVYSQVNKDRQQPGIMYAELGFNNAGSTTDQPRGAQQEVLYSDVQTKM